MMHTGRESSRDDTGGNKDVSDKKDYEPAIEEKEGQEDDSSPVQGLHQDTLAQALDSHKKTLEEIRTLLESRLCYDAAKEKAIHALSEELNLYKEKFVYRSQKPIFIDLILLYDNLTQILDYLENREHLSHKEFAKVKGDLLNIKEELLEIFYRRDITPYNEHPGMLNYKLHKTVSTIPTPVESENNKVEKIIKTGFFWNGKVLRPEEVIIKKYYNE